MMYVPILSTLDVVLQNDTIMAEVCDLRYLTYTCNASNFSDFIDSWHC